VRLAVPPLAIALLVAVGVPVKAPEATSTWSSTLSASGSETVALRTTVVEEAVPFCAIAVEPSAWYCASAEGVDGD
jgi:hypothetical protein